MYQGLVMGVSRVLHRCFKGVSRVFSWVDQGFSRVCLKGVKGYFENVSRIFQVCFIGVSGCFVHVRRMVQGSCKGTAFLFQM